MDGVRGLFFLGIEVALKHDGKLFWLEATINDGLEAVAKKLHALMAIQERGIFSENLAFLGSEDVIFDRDETTTSSFGEKLIEQLE